MNKFALPFLAILILMANSCADDDQTFDDDAVEILTGVDLTDIPYDPVAYDLNAPDSFPEMEIPADNPMTVAGQDLGRHLFYDPILSADSTMSCSSCHLPSASFTDNEAVSLGIDGVAGTRSSMSLLNIGYNFNGLFWDGRVLTLEEQALLPVEDAIELHNTWPNVVGKLQESEMYRTKFRQAFGIANSDEITKELTAKALAQFERSLVSSGNSRFDQVINLPSEDFEEDELMGYQMFFDLNGVNDAECFHCHEAPFFTNQLYINNGIENVPDLNSFPDIGYGAVTGLPFDNGRFRVPTLRNIEFTAPYMHDGRFQTLEEVIEHYNSGGHNAANLDTNMRELNMTEEQKAALLAFLKTLSDPDFMENPAYQNPF